jgi:hypothetical protein
MYKLIKDANWQNVTRGKYGHLPQNITTVTPWKQVCVCVDLIGSYTFKAKDKTVLDVMCLTMIDPATS